MEQSDKHGPVRDDSMAAETRGETQGGHSPRVEEWHDPEPAGEDQPEASAMPEEQGVGGSPPGMTSEDVAGRSELARAVPPSAFPGRRDDLVAAAADAGAPDAVLAALRSLPASGRYHTVSEVWSDLGHGTENDERRF